MFYRLPLMVHVKSGTNTNAHNAGLLDLPVLRVIYAFAAFSGDSTQLLSWRVRRYVRPGTFPNEGYMNSKLRPEIEHHSVNDFQEHLPTLRLFYFDRVTLALPVGNDDNGSSPGIYIRMYGPRPGAITVLVCGTSTNSIC